jgi:TRAP-type mannitol/chloroaromatic compound transport system permease small subunit
LARFVRFVDTLSLWVGHSFAWCILILMLGTSYEVFVRYVLRAPTGWAFDVGYMMYGAIFLMGGAYTLSRNGHVRGDVVYRTWSQPTQAKVDLVLYILFYFPATLALMYAGWTFAAQSWRFKEVSIWSPANIPIYPMKTLIPIAGLFLFLQGVAEIFRCIECIRSGRWPLRLHDVEELESAVQHAQEDEARSHPAGAVR